MLHMVCSQAEHGVLQGIGQLCLPICPTSDIQLNYFKVHCRVWLSPAGNGLSLYDISIQGIRMLGVPDPIPPTIQGGVCIHGVCCC